MLMKRLLILTMFLAACGGSGDAPTPTPDKPEPAPEPDRAPWSAALMSAAEVPPVYLEEWRAAENRATCAPLAFRTPEPEEAEPRAATFGGGWGVAYDLPDLRSAFGVAGTGVEPSPTTYDDWPYRIRWADGSEAGYGPEGGSGQKQLAYLEVAGQECLYNVWSRLGIRHLEGLLETLRFVQPSGE